MTTQPTFKSRRAFENVKNASIANAKKAAINFGEATLDDIDALALKVSRLETAVRLMVGSDE